MKKIFAAVAAVLLLTSITMTTAFAESTTYSFPEYGLSYSVPEDFYVITQDMDEMDDFTSDYNDIMIMYDEEDNWIMSVNAYELSVGAMDFADYTEDGLNALAEAVMTDAFSGDENVEMLEYGTTTVGDIPYIFYHYSAVSDGYVDEMINCYTIVNQMNYSFYIVSVGALSEVQIAYLDDVIASAVFSTPIEGGVMEIIPAETESTEEITPVETESAEAITPVVEPEITALETDTLDVQDTGVSGAYRVGLVLGSLIGGALMGLIPLIAGLKKHQKVLAWVGFCVSILCHLLLGLILSLPVALVFLSVILAKAKKNKPDDGNQAGGYPQTYDPQDGSQAGGYSQTYDPQNWGQAGGYPQTYDPQNGSQGGNASGQDPWAQNQSNDSGDLW